MLTYPFPHPPNARKLVGGAALLQLAGWARGFHSHNPQQHHRPFASPSATRQWIRPHSSSSSSQRPATTTAATPDGGATTTTGPTPTSSSSSTVMESNRAGYFRTFDLAGAPPMDPIVRSQVRERLREKRREPFSKEKGLEVLQLLNDSRCVVRVGCGCWWVNPRPPRLTNTPTTTINNINNTNSVVPVRVLVDVDLRQTLRLTRREKKARLFLPREAVKGSLQGFLDHVYRVRDWFFEKKKGGGDCFARRGVIDRTDGRTPVATR